MTFSITPPPSGLLLFGEVEDLAVRLSQVLLLFEVHLKRTLDGYEGDAALVERETVLKTHYSVHNYPDGNHHVTGADRK